jgi:hypothetical protein
MNLELIKALARPFTTYVGAVGVLVGLYIPDVSADKLWVAAALTGTMGIARSFDKRTPTPGEK